MPYPEHDKSKLDSLETKLYNTKNVTSDVLVHDVRSHHADQLPTTWGDNSPLIVKAAVESKMSLGVKILLYSLLFLLVTGGYTVWKFMSFQNVVSSENIDVISDMKPYVEGGEDVPVSISINNRNKISIQDAVLTLSYEKGIGSGDEQQKVYEKRVIGVIPPNQVQKQSFSVSIYGEEADSRIITTKLEYKVAGSNALFSKVIANTAILKTPPVTVHMDGPTMLASGQVGAYTITVRNNTSSSSVPFRLVCLTPDTFVRDSAIPKVSTPDTGWDVQGLASGETKTFTVKGSFTGNSGQIFTMKALAGNSKGGRDISVIFSSDKKETTVRTTPLLLSLQAETDRGVGDTLRFGDNAIIVVKYQNISDQEIRNAEIKATLEGDGILYDSVTTDGGYYDSTKNTIVWNKTTTGSLTSIAPHASGELRIFAPVVSKGKNNPSLKVSIDGSADEKEVADVSTSISKTYAIQGSASLNVWTSFRDSPFANTGPVPPKANTDTTYTLHLKASAQNTLTNAKISFILPIYVTWRGTFTEGQTITYNADTRTVTWDMGTIQAAMSPSADVQVSLRPSQSHVGLAPNITSGITLEGTEKDSKAKLRITVSPLTTVLTHEAWGGDPASVIGQ
jgi:hypothetical protein